ncbi:MULTISPECIES: metallophosphoesterase [Paraburkholderia]|uniref:Metallophosphoesterase n=1 Tax=Paraburkholderia madseniana TaxID=2599607 RepID=A0AAP5BLN9_9BURK|nr:MULTISPECIES: metallophosphoesterase [Paraburkholderia]MCX4151768.1 metallophosphoesterase [Paraburkholderia madseniana]MDN7154695.1 metallophosphoesterase [Paraburkholderia sp. WS6]MDQ6413578.1 metallophosphoesterase [Paraburkholderia madseniana]
MGIVKTYIHISDLHFAGPTQRFFYDRWARYFPVLDGLVGHDPNKLNYLENTYGRLKATEPDVDLVVTGDLTAQSLDSEFDDAECFLETVTPAPTFYGLGVAAWKDLAVPGNHDQWPGIPFTPIGTCNARVRAIFPHTASVTHSFTLANGVPVVFLELNGDADVGAASPERVLARGSFVSAIHRLRNLLDRRDDREVRILLLHHSIEFPGRSYPFMTERPLSIDDPSRTEIEKLLSDYDIRVVLTGHAHEPFFVGPLQGVAGRAGFGVMESRCGTTTQRLKKRGLNSLFVHRVERDASTHTFIWRSSLYTHGASRSARFTAVGATCQGRTAEDRIQIFP